MIDTFPFPCAAIGSIKQPGAPLHFGDRVSCTEQAGVFRHCNYCGHNVFTIGRASGPHLAHMRCDGCGRGGRFLSRRYCPRVEPLS